MEIFADTKYDLLVVFPKGALIVKSFNIKFSDDNDNEIIIRNLNKNIDFATLELSSDFKILDLSFVKEKLSIDDFVEDDDAKMFLIFDEREKVFSEKIRAYKEGLKDIIVKFAENTLIGKTSADKFEELYNFIEDDIAFARYSISIVNARKRRISRLLKEKGFYPGIKSQITIRVDRKGKNEGKIEMRYFIKDISWRPFYKLRIKERNIELSLFAIINVGEGDFIKVSKLILKGKTPERVYIHEVKPIYIPHRKIVRAREEKVLRAARMHAPTLALAEKFEKEEEIYATSSIEIGEDVEIVVNRLVILEPKKENMLFIGKKEFKGEEIYLWNAPIGDDVIRAFKFVTDMPIIPGRGIIYSEGIPIGEVYFEYKPKGGEVMVPLEKERNIICKKELLRRESEKKGMVKERAVDVFEYQLLCKNYKEKDIDMIVVDRIPQSIDPGIKVKLDYVEPKPYEEKLGIMKWRLKIPQKKEVEIRYSFKIEHPLDAEIKI